MKKIKCPACHGKKKDCVACKGKGLLNPPKPKHFIQDTDNKMSKAAKALRKKGYNLREIAAILGYRLPQSIQHLLDKK